MGALVLEWTRGGGGRPVDICGGDAGNGGFGNPERTEAVVTAQVVSKV